MKIRFEFGSEDSRKFSFRTGTSKEETPPQDETAGEKSREYSFDTSKIKNEDAREFVEDVLSIFSTAARGLKERIADYEQSARTNPEEQAELEPAQKTQKRAVVPEGTCGEALIAAGFGDRAIEVVPYGTQGAAVVPLRDGDDEVELWRTVKEAVAPAGCYPVYVMMDDLERPLLAPVDILDLDTGEWGRMSEVREALFAQNPWPIREPILESFQYITTVRRFGRGPTQAELTEADLVTENDLDEFLWRWERATFGDEAVIAAGKPDAVSWFEPGIEEQKLLVLPMPDGPNAIRVLGFFPTDDRPGWIEPLGADLASWQREFGAEMVANYGTMLHFVVENPPTDLDTSYRLAKEHEHVATATLPLPGITRRHYAADLIGRTRWFLHDRP